MARSPSCYGRNPRWTIALDADLVTLVDYAGVPRSLLAVVAGEYARLEKAVEEPRALLLLHTPCSGLVFAFSNSKDASLRHGTRLARMRFCSSPHRLDALAPPYPYSPALLLSALTELTLACCCLDRRRHSARNLRAPRVAR